jgi:hypothetical protein
MDLRRMKKLAINLGYIIRRNYNLYKLHNIVKTAKSGKLYWTKYMAKWGGKERDSEF